MKKITIIIPCYNLGRFVIPMLDSLGIANLDLTEIIIINDASTDNTLELIKGFKNFNKSWRLIENKTNKGLSETRNIGVSLASSRYIYFLDGDDILTEEYSALENIDLNLPFYRLRKSHNGRKKIKSNYLESVQVSTMLIHKELFSDSALLFPKDIIFEDNHFSMLVTDNLHKNNKFFYGTIKLNPFKYTQFREGSITSTKQPKNKIIDSFERMKDLCAEDKIKSFFTYQLWNSFMVNTKLKYDGFVLQEDKETTFKYLKDEFKKIDLFFWDLPILWKIRFLSYKLFKFVF